MYAHAKWESLVVGVLVLISATAHGEIPELPDMDLSTAEMAYQGPETLTLMITPDGTGGYFTTARTPSGAIADATWQYSPEIFSGHTISVRICTGTE